MRVKSVSVVVVILVFLSVVNTPQTKADSWWNYDWQYRLSVTIDNTGGPLTDYQVKVTLDLSFDYSKAKTNGEDIRFIDSNNNVLNYWIEKWNVSGDSIIWVKISSIPGASTEDIYMYYGNPSASSASNGTSTFEFFDDFSTNTSDNYDMVKWVDIHGTPASGFDTPQYDAVNERMTFDTGDNIQADMYPKNFTIDNFLIRVDFWADLNYPTNATMALVGRLQNPGTSSTHYYLDFSHGNYDSPGITIDSWINGERSNGIYSEPSDYYWEFNNIHTVRYAIYENTHRFWWNKEADQTPDIIATDNTHLDAGRVGFAPAQVRGWVDDFIVRKYTHPEPTTTLGSEQRVPAVSQIPPIIQNLWGVDIINIGSEGTFAVENGMKVGRLTLEKGENEILVDVYNKGILKAHNVKLEVLNLPWARIEISPKAADILKRSIQTYTISLDIPESVPSGLYIIKIKAKGNFILETIEIEVEIR